MAELNFAQAPLLCEFCDTSPDVKWKCFDCSLALCEKCNQKLHSKVKAAKEHTIVDIRSTEAVKALADKPPELTKIECKYHSKQLCCFFCVLCDELICPSCVLKSHKDHNFKDIQESYNDKRTSLQTSVETVKNETVVAVRKEKAKLDNIKQMKSHQRELHKQKIIAQKEELKKLIDNYSFKLLYDVDSSYKSACDSLEAEYIKLDMCEHRLSEHLKSTENALMLDNPQAIFTHAKAIDQDFEFSKATPLCSITDFVTKTTTLYDIKSFFGFLTKIEVNETYTTNLPVVHNIATSGEAVWINNDKVKVLERLQTGKHLQKSTQFDNIEVISMACNQSGEVIVAKQRPRKLEIISPSGSGSGTFCDLSPLFPTSIHVTSTGDIMVGVIEITAGTQFYTLSEGSRRQLIVLTPSGKQKAVYEYDNENKRLFTVVSGITTTHTGDIVIHDRTSENFNGRVLMIDTESRLKWEYTGNLSFNNKKKEFRPRSVVATNECNIIVSDFENHLLHILSNHGNLLTCVVTTEIGIQLPYSLDIDSNGILWVGCSVYQGQPNEAKLHALKITGI